jgi:hypothetical protein
LTLASNAATSVGDFIKRIASLPLEDDGQTKWAVRIQNEIKNRLQGLTAWDVQQREIQAYVGELVQAADHARNLTNDFFHAQLASAEVMIPAMKALQPDSPTSAINLLDDYVSKGMGTLGQGFSRVQNGAFAELASTIDQGAAMADKVRCAVARPAAIIAGLSRDLGALSGSGPGAIAKLANQLTSATDLAPKLDDLKNAIPDAKLFSVLPLRELIAALNADTGELARNQIPAVTQATLPDHFEQVWEWTTKVASKDFGFVAFKVSDDAESQVKLHISSVTRIDTPKSEAEARQPHGTVTTRGFLGYWDEQTKQADTSATVPAFDLVILGLIDVAFYYVEFSSQAAIGGSPTTKLTPHMGPIEFLGPLKFVKTLESFLSSLLGDAFHVELTPDHIEIGFDLIFPPITVGACTLRNVAVGASLRLSFTNQPLRFGFNFARKKRRCELAVMCFGGTAFLEVGLLSDGTKELEGALEFGGILAFDVGVAYGELYLLAGFHFRITNTLTDLSGYLRAGGDLYVLELIHASVEFILAGKYRTEALPGGGNRHQIYGICTITVSIDLFLFSAHVSISMEKKIDGSSDSGSQQAKLRRSSVFQFASSRREVEADVEPLPVAYFERDWRDVRGRFPYPESKPTEIPAAIDAWDRDYWSQFGFGQAAPQGV